MNDVNAGLLIGAMLLRSSSMVIFTVSRFLLSCAYLMSEGDQIVLPSFVSKVGSYFHTTLKINLDGRFF